MLQIPPPSSVRVYRIPSSRLQTNAVLSRSPPFCDAQTGQRCQRSRSLSPGLITFKHSVNQGSLRRRGGGVKGGPIFRTTNVRTFSTNEQSRFASVVCGSDLGPPRLTWHTWRRYPCIFSVVPEAKYTSRLRALKGYSVRPKNPSRFRNRD